LHTAAQFIQYDIREGAWVSCQNLPQLVFDAASQLHVGMQVLEFSQTTLGAILLGTATLFLQG